MLCLINFIIIIQNLILRGADLLFTFLDIGVCVYIVCHIPSLFTSLLLLTSKLPFRNLFTWLKDFLCSKQQQQKSLCIKSLLLWFSSLRVVFYIQ